MSRRGSPQGLDPIRLGIALRRRDAKRAMAPAGDLCPPTLESRRGRTGVDNGASAIDAACMLAGQRWNASRGRGAPLNKRRPCAQQRRCCQHTSWLASAALEARRGQWRRRCRHSCASLLCRELHNVPPGRVMPTEGATIGLGRVARHVSMPSVRRVARLLTEGL